jgi:hypothetical protein
MESLVNGRDWYKRFKQRWKHTLSEKEAENIAKARAASCTKNHLLMLIYMN